MAKGKGKQVPLAASGLFPVLAKTAHAIGKYCLVPGSFWMGCPAADKKKLFQCIVTEFDPIHTLHGGRKGAAMKAKEMGESGEGSLEPGVASGDDIVVGYPTPFLEYFYAANPDMLPAANRPKPPVAEVEGATQSPTPAHDPPVKDEKETDRPPIFEYLNPISSTLNTAGPKRGSYTNKYTCAIACAGGMLCGGSITLYGNGKSETTSNAWSHIRDKAEKCPFHKVALEKLDVTNAKRVQDVNGEFVKVHSFEEAFPHHVEYVWCRAGGIFGAHTGKKPQFRTYVRG